MAGGHALATGDQIEKAISGNTVQGSMVDGSRYTEFYAANGTIHGSDYKGHWHIKDNQMCFKYGEDPANCWSVEVEGDQVFWVVDGKKDGSGTVVPGNPNNF